ncbi:hypothetical protein MUCCIDRAFT_109548 [Mucor lusitanicus CBS 277.49]|uniref:Resolvase/invertase-type recombinase catalytic domain-containing protein n=1 Tax=Mucor lusitanicus CBS 277.49 TaxID=747725 RepID=A0A168KSN8_MUCCL|nr:hypothetical protein MUCCIDRAFT_109548 [Mucor lusitanicus CBS 277.49]
MAEAERALKRKRINAKRKRAKRRNAGTKEYSMEELQDLVLQRTLQQQQRAKNSRQTGKMAIDHNLTIEACQIFSTDLIQTVANHNASIDDDSQRNEECSEGGDGCSDSGHKPPLPLNPQPVREVFSLAPSENVKKPRRE